MVTWQDYLYQSQSEKKACLVLYEQGHYGLAAYHMQQAIEKITKAFLFKHGLSQIPLITHTPLLYLENILPLTKRIERKAKQFNISFKRGQSANHHDNYIQQCVKIRSELGDPCFKRAIWKNSLRMQLDTHEKKVFDKYPAFKEYYKFNLTEILDFGDNSARVERFVNRINSDADTHEGASFKTVAVYARMIVSAFPHEEYGRYPVDVPVNGTFELTTSLYEKRKADLKEMIDVVLREVPAR